MKGLLRYLVPAQKPRAAAGHTYSCNMLLLLLLQPFGVPDPNCATGVSTDESNPSAPGATCCDASCATCGGLDCGHSIGGSAACCIGTIKAENRSCAKVGPPCVMPPAPAPHTACGDYPSALSTTMPNALMIGDSISMSVPYTPGGYGVPAKAMLLNHSIAPAHAGGWAGGGQASNTVKGLLCTDPATPGNWLNFTGNFDVIHFNFGLHDLVDAGPGEGQEHVDIPQYGKNLAIIYARLAARAKKVIWTATTPCPNVTTSMGRSDQKVIAYNVQAMASLTAAAAAAGKGTLLVDDLHAAVDGYCGVNYKTCALQRPKNVHFEPMGCTFLATKVVASIVSALATP